MKQQMLRFAQRIDAMSLRERVITFAMMAVLLVYLVNSFVIDPLFARQKMQSEKMAQDQAQIAAIRMAVQQKIKAHAVDPDADNVLRLQQLKQQFAQAQDSLMAMQKGLIPPDRMARVVEDILARHGSLRLISLKTLPVASLEDGARQVPQSTSVPQAPVAAAAPGAMPAAKEEVPRASASIYRHGVEITLQGNYLEMMQYMAALEAMPWQLFWSQAKLTVDEYPKATLTLNLFTLSLDKKWLNL